MPKISLPEWSKVLHNGDMNAFYNEVWSSIPFVPKIARQKYGYMLNDILRRFKDKLEAKQDLNRKIWFYSGHDSSITGLLSLFHVKLVK